MTLFQDDFGTITHDTAHNILTLTWSPQTADMSDEDFQRSNLALAIFADEHKVQHLIVDVEHFAHQFGPELGSWRNRNILPIYARAGVSKMAFVHGTGFNGPREGGMPGESFVTHHYASLDEAMRWLLA